MIIVMRMGAEAHEVGGVIQRIQELGYQTARLQRAERVIVGIIGNDRPLDPEHFLSLSGVEKVIPILQPYKLASRDFKPCDTVIRVNDALIGGDNVTFMAGPCSVESREQTFEIARQLRDMGVKIMRGGAFKPRTSPYSFQGMGEEGLQILADVREELGMSIITEVMAPDEVALVARYADILADRHAQYAELPPAGRGGQAEQAGAAQAGNELHYRGIAACRRIYTGARQHAGDAVRARHPHLREGHPLHLRHQRYTGAQVAHPPACDRRPQPRHRALGPRHARIAGGGGGGGRRPDRRSAQPP